MSNFGAGFAALALVAVLCGLALFSGVVAVAVLVVRRRTGRIPTALPVLSVLVLVAVAGVSGFGVLALFDESFPAAAILVALVWIPLGVAWSRVRRTTDAGRLDSLAAATTAWGVPFVVGVAVVVAVVAGAQELLGLPSTSPQRVRTLWVGVVAGSVVAVGGAVGLASRTGRLFGERS